MRSSHLSKARPATVILFCFSLFIFLVSYSRGIAAVQAANTAGNIASDEVLPDLAPTALTAPAQAPTQHTVEISWTVKNQGNGEALPSWFNDIYLSTDQVWSDTDLALGGDYYGDVLASGASYTQKMDVVIPNVPAGNYYIILRVDPWSQIYESDESNNLRVVPITVTTPDLAPTALTAPAQAPTQHTVEISWTVKNQGNGEALPSWFNDIYLSTDQVWSDTDLALGGDYYGDVLASGASYTQKMDVVIPNVPAGNYYIIFRVDPWGQIYESDESNNLRVVPITVTTPDLAPTALTAPAQAPTQHTVEISWTVKNQGNGEALPSWYNDIYLSTDQVWSDTDLALGGDYYGDALASGASYTQKMDVVIPNVPAGNYYIIFRVDPWSQIYESDESNNLRVVPITVTTPDLAPTALTAPAQAPTQHTVEVSWTVKNQGNGEALPSWFNDIYLSTDQVWSDTDLALGGDYYGDVLASGASYTQKMDVVIPNVPAGNYYIIFRVDPWSQIYESDESNNLRVVPITVTTPDLAPTALTAPAQAPTQHTVEVSWTVKNQGNGEALPSWYNDIYLSTDQVWSDTDLALGGDYYGDALASGASYTQKMDVVIPNVPAGNYYIIFRVDPWSQIYESDESNNLRVIPFTVTTPDLAPTAVTGPPKAAAEHTVEISWTVKNQGNGEANPSWTDRLYISGSKVLDGQERQLGDYSRQGPVASGSTYTRTERVRIPDIPAGSYYLILQADVWGSVYESNESNNVVAGNIVVTIPETVDQPQTTIEIEDFASGLGDLDFSPDGLYLAVAGGNLGFLFDMQTGQLRHRLSGHTNTIQSVDFSPGGDQILFGAMDGTARIWDASSLQQVRSFSSVANQPNPATFSADGTKVLAGSGMGLPRIWNAVSGTELHALAGHTGSITAVAFSPDGSKALTGSTDNTAIVWDVQSGTADKVLALHAGTINAVAFSPSGTQLLTGSDDGTVRLWDAGTGSPTGIFIQESGVSAAVYTPDGKYVLSAGGGNACLWEIASGGFVRTFQVEGDAIEIGGVDVSPDQSLVATTHVDGKVRVWRSGLNTIPLHPVTSLVLGADQQITLSSHSLYYFEVTAEAGRSVLISLNPGTASSDSMTSSQPGVADAGPRFANLPNGSTKNDFSSKAAGGTLSGITIDPTAVRVMVKKDALPSACEYDYIAQSPLSSLHLEIPAASSTAAKYYIMVYSPFLADGTINARLLAEYSDFHLSGISPAKGGNAGSVTLQIKGTGFDDSTVARLIAPGGQVVVGETVMRRSSTEMFATFDLRGASLGTCGVQIQKPECSPVLLSGAFTVAAGSGAKLQTKLVPPTSVRPQRDYTAWLEYANAGDADMPAPLFLVSTAEKSIPMWLISYLKVDITRTAPQTTGIQVLGINQDGPAGILPPGAGFRFPIRFKSNTSLAEIVFNLDRVAADDTLIDWQALEAKVRPTDMDPGLWAMVWAQFKSKVGDTWADYIKLLTDQATYLSQYSGATCDVNVLLSGIFSQPTGANFRKTLALGIDAYSPGRVLPLVFMRAATNSVSERFAVGPVGRSWTHNWEYSLTRPDDETIVIQGPGATGREFTMGQAGSWYPSPGDYGTLAPLEDGGWILTETTGETWLFDSSGLLRSLGEPNGNAIVCEYSDDRLTALTHSNGQAFKLEYDSMGRLLHLTDHSGRVTEYVYDSTGEELISVISPSGLTTGFTYVSSEGSASDHALESITYPSGTHRYFSYDDQGRLSAEWRDNGTERVEYGYGEKGDVSVKDAAGATAVMRLGSRGELLEAEDPLGNVARFEYDQDLNLIRTVGPDGATTDAEYDSAGNAIRVTDPLENVVSMAYVTPLTRMSRLQDARGNPTSLSHDGKGNLTGMAYPDAHSEAFAYDAAGDVIQATNRRGEAIKLAYDTFGRITRKDYPDGRYVIYAYDSAGRITAVTDQSGVIEFQYDQRGLLVHISYPSGHSFAYTYDNGGRPLQRVSEDGYTLNYHYDYEAGGRLQRLTDGSGAEIVRYAYDVTGFLTNEIKANGTNTTYEYDAAGRLIHLVNYSPGGAVQSRFDYTYDANGNPTSMKTLQGTTSYTYDLLGQLIGVTYPDGKRSTYEYDASGNRVTVNERGTAKSYTTNNMNQYEQVGDAADDYDANGNMVSVYEAAGKTTYEYDVSNQLVRVVNPTLGTWEYAYDALGNRTSVEHDGTVTRYVHDPAGLADVAAEYDGGGNLVARYVHGAGLVSRLGADGKAGYYAFDGTGHTRQITDASGTVINTYDYSPFGIALAAAEQMSNPFRYVGRFGVMEDGNGLKFMRARYFDPSLGRFLTADPLNLSGGINLYMYCRNNPITYIDPLGLIYWDMVIRGLIQAASGILEIKYAAEVAIASAPGIFTFIIVCPSIHFMVLDGKIRFAAGLVEIYNGIMENKNKLSMPDSLIGCLASGIEDPVAKKWIMIADNIVSLLMNRLKRQPQRLLAENIPDLVLLGDLIIDQLKDIYNAVAEAWARSTVVRPADPNDKIGPPGIGVDRTITAEDEIAYMVRFENMATATAPVQELVVVDYLDASLDWSSLKYADIAYGKRVLSLPQDVSQYSTRDFPGTSCLVGTSQGEMGVDVNVSLNPQMGRVEWRLRVIDTATGLPPEDPLAGILPPEDGTGRGQGYVSFLVKPKLDTALGARIANTAKITFDTNDPISTNEVWNTIGNPPAETGSVTVTILPQAAVAAGAKWKVSGDDTWKGSGETVSGIVVGQHLITFSDVSGWSTPLSQTVNVTTGTPASATGTYVQQTGSVTVTILPQAAVAAGAKWKVSGDDTWKGSGETVSGIVVGQHLITFSDVSGWSTPLSQTVNVTTGTPASATGTYVQQIGSVTVTILPAAAVAAGAKWKVSGDDTWKGSGETVSELSVGQHTVTFNGISGWSTPASQTVNVTTGTPASATGTYVQQTGSVTATILPAAAVAAGARWKISGDDAWKGSGETVSGLSVGQHLITFSDVSGWSTPLSQTVNVTTGTPASATGTYVQQTGSVTVTILPQAAVAAGAKWKVSGDDAWKTSGETVSGIAVGSHKVEFKPTPGWTAPASMTATVEDGRTTAARGTYTRQTGSLQVTIAPPAAVSAGARWKVDTGNWLPSGRKFTGLAVGKHKITFKPVKGWKAPATKTLTITKGKLTKAQGTYKRQVR